MRANYASGEGHATAPGAPVPPLDGGRRAAVCWRMRTVHAVTGPVRSDALGTTLMHEHLMVGYPGWQAEAVADRASRREFVARCVDRLQELRGHGLGTLVDPCPIDLGRDVELMAEVAQASGVQIVCATGLYKEDEGAAAYFKFRQHWGDALGEMTDLFVRELTEGVDDTGIRAGVIKVATGVGRITPYEETVLRAAGRAHKATGAPITTHTDQGTMGREQLDLLASEGVDPQAVLVGHSCGASDVLPSGDARSRRDRLRCFGLRSIPTGSASRC
jgi:phosphotriesterase-related protein